MNIKISLYEDDIAEAIKSYLEKSGYTVMGDFDIKYKTEVEGYGNMGSSKTVLECITVTVK